MRIGGARPESGTSALQTADQSTSIRSTLVRLPGVVLELQLDVTELSCPR